MPSSSMKMYVVLFSTDYTQLQNTNTNIVYIYGPKAAGREKSALRVTKQPSLRDTSWPNDCFQQLALLDSWKSLSREYTQRFSRFWDHPKGP